MCLLLESARKVTAICVCLSLCQSDTDSRACRCLSLEPVCRVTTVRVFSRHETVVSSQHVLTASSSTVTYDQSEHCPPSHRPTARPTGTQLPAGWCGGESSEGTTTDDLSPSRTARPRAAGDADLHYCTDNRLRVRRNTVCTVHFAHTWCIHCIVYMNMFVTPHHRQGARCAVILTSYFHSHPSFVPKSNRLHC